MNRRKLSDRQRARISRKQADLIKADNPENQRDGVVICSFGKEADVECLTTGELVRCFIRPNTDLIVTGDRVVWQTNEATEEVSGVIVAAHPRETELTRPDSFGKLKLVAANIDKLVITIAPKPEAFGNLVDRYLVAAHKHNLEPLVLVNKSDLIGDDDPLLSLVETYQNLGYEILFVSAKQQQNLPALQTQLRGGTCIFTGQSGVGKSSVIQALLPDEQIKVGKLSEAVTKGKHTTTHAKLYHFPSGGHCVDSPGIREFGLWHMTADDVIDGFIEFSDFVGQCKFRNCQHQSEPGCAIQKCIEEGHLSETRLNSFNQILQSLDEVSMR